MGARLRPLTLSCPKPLLRVGNLPIIARIILALRKQGISDFLFLLHYRAQDFIDYLGNGDRFDAVFQFEVIDRDLSTAGSVRFVSDQITETTLICSADVLADIPVSQMLDYHRQKLALATIALCSLPIPLSYGIVMCRRDGKITRFREKPDWPEVFSDWINSGIYLIEPGLTARIPNDRRMVHFETEVFPQLAEAHAGLFGFPLSGYWRDIGTPEDLRQANLEFLAGKLPADMYLPGERSRRAETLPGGIAQPGPMMPTGKLRRYVDNGSLIEASQDRFDTGFLYRLGKSFGRRQCRQSTAPKRASPSRMPAILLATMSSEERGGRFRALAEGVAAAGCHVHLLENVTLPTARHRAGSGMYQGSMYLGFDEFLRVFRLVLLHSNGVSFSSEETARLEFVDTSGDHAVGRMEHLNANHVRRNYLADMKRSLGSQYRLPDPGKLGIHVAAASRATRQATEEFLRSLDLAIPVSLCPFNRSATICRGMKSVKSTLLHSHQNRHGPIFWLGGTGERLLLVQENTLSHCFGTSDAIIAGILQQNVDQRRSVVASWLVPPFVHSEISNLGPHVIQVPHTKLADAENYCRLPSEPWYGFDGLGGITISEWMRYPDALMALAHTLRCLPDLETFPSENVDASASTRYRLVACTEEKKAQVMRNLVTDFCDLDLEIGEGIRIWRDSEWVVVRPGAGRPVLEVFHYDPGLKKVRSRNSARSLLADVVNSIRKWARNPELRR